MGIMGYITAYFIIGYVITCIAAMIAPPQAEGERGVDILTLAVTCGWGVIAIVMVFRLLCVPVLLLRRARLSMTKGGVSINE